jgi:hypothetical protein
MTPFLAYQKIILAMNDLHDKSDKFAKRINKKSKKYKYFRIPEYEKFFINDVKFSYYYARDVVHGKLPEAMHNFMICEALANSNNAIVKKYFEICKGNFPITNQNLGLSSLNMERQMYGS